MNHTDIRHKLSEHLDNAVSETEKAEIEAHLKTCTECSNAIEELRKTIEQVRQIEEIESPAWMTAKIMAQVREEAVKKQGMFQRFFRPLMVKMPIQTVAVLFLAVTAYYIYQNINPAEKYAETPMEIEAKKDMISSRAAGGKEPVIQQPESRVMKIEQGKGYKSLDMKYAYEKPAPPTPVKEEAPAGRAQLPMAAGAGAAADAPGPKRQLSRSAESEIMMDKEERFSDHAELSKARSAAPAAPVATMAGSEAKPDDKITLSLSVTDIAAAEEEVDQTLDLLKAKILHREISARSLILSVSLDARSYNQLKDKLEKVGVLKKEDRPSGREETTLKIKIQLDPVTRK